MYSEIKFVLKRWSFCCLLIFSFMAAANIATSVQSRDFNEPFQSADLEAAFWLQQFASFQDTCRNISINGSLLSARCRTSRGDYVSTSIEIRGITNVNGVLEYLRDGRGRSTFQETCRDMRINGANLSASCQREDGSYNYSSIFLRYIINNNGRLEYERNSGGGGNNPIDPPSSSPSNFQDSCRNIRVSLTTLSAECRDDNRRWRNSSIEIRGVTNVNGNLEYLRDGRGRSSYQDSCTDIRINGANLSAQCQREDGSYNNTSIFLRGINNNSGRLEYSRNSEELPPINPPSGNDESFENSCRNIRVSSTTLSAECRDNNRRWRNTSIEIRGITNVNGNLEYLRDGRGRSTYQETCTDINIDRTTLRARCQRENGSYRRTSISLTGIVNDDGRLRYRLN